MAAGIGDKLLREDAEDPLTLEAFERYFSGSLLVQGRPRRGQDPQRQQSSRP